MPARYRVLKVGEITVAIDGTKVLANASRYSAVNYGRAEIEARAFARAQQDRARKAPDQSGPPAPRTNTITPIRRAGSSLRTGRPALNRTTTPGRRRTGEPADRGPAALQATNNKEQ